MQVGAPVPPRLPLLLICLDLDLLFSAATTAKTVFSTAAFSQARCPELLRALAHPRAELVPNVPIHGAMWEAVCPS